MYTTDIGARTDAQDFLYSYRSIRNNIVIQDVNCKSTEARLRDCAYSNYSSLILTTHLSGIAAPLEESLVLDVEHLRVYTTQQVLSWLPQQQYYILV